MLILGEDLRVMIGILFLCAVAIALILTIGEAWYERKFPWHCGKWLLLLCIVGLFALLF
jgi:hypothetical protein